VRTVETIAYVGSVEDYQIRTAPAGFVNPAGAKAATWVRYIAPTELLKYWKLLFYLTAQGLTPTFRYFHKNP